MSYFVTEEEMNKAIEKNSNALLTAVSKFSIAEKDEIYQRLVEVEGRINVILNRKEAEILKTLFKILEEANFRAEGNAGHKEEESLKT